MPNESELTGKYVKPYDEDDEPKPTTKPVDITPPPIKPAIAPCYRISIQAAGFPGDILQGVGVDKKESVLKVAQAHAARIQSQWEKDAREKGHPRGKRPRVKVWMLIGEFSIIVTLLMTVGCAARPMHNPPTLRELCHRHWVDAYCRGTK